MTSASPRPPRRERPAHTPANRRRATSVAAPPALAAAVARGKGTGAAGGPTESVFHLVDRDEAEPVARDELLRLDDHRLRRPALHLVEQREPRRSGIAGGDAVELQE